GIGTAAWDAGNETAMLSPAEPLRAPAARRTRVHQGEAVTLTKGWLGRAARASLPRVLSRGILVTGLIRLALGNFYPRYGAAYHRRRASPHDEGGPSAGHLTVGSGGHQCPDDEQDAGHKQTWPHAGLVVTPGPCKTGYSNVG